MIHVDLPATMECIAKDCGARLGIKLALTVGGTLIARPPNGHGWQVTFNPQGVILARCPQHHVDAIDEGPPRITNADPGIVDLLSRRH